MWRFLALCRVSWSLRLNFFRYEKILGSLLKHIYKFLHFATSLIVLIITAIPVHCVKSKLFDILQMKIHSKLVHHPQLEKSVASLKRDRFGVMFNHIYIAQFVTNLTSSTNFIIIITSPWSVIFHLTDIYFWNYCRTTPSYFREAHLACTLSTYALK